MKYLVIGETMVDVYLFWSSPRKDPATMVPVIRDNSWNDALSRRKEAPGGAANMVKLLREKIGENDTVKFYSNILNFPIKYRIYVNDLPLFRFDQEDYISHDSGIIAGFINDIKNYDAVIVSNYHKGLLNEEDIRSISKECRKQRKVSFIDTNTFNENYLGYCYTKINRKTAEKALDGLGGKFTYTENLAKDLHREYSEKSDYLRDYGAIIVTEGSEGCTYSIKGEFGSSRLTKIKYDIVDSIGAGDSFFAVLVYFLMNKNYKLYDACIGANEAALQSCKKLGTL